jgi:hypothetical protein
MFHWILWESCVQRGRCHCSTQVSSGDVLERRERCNEFAPDERGRKALSATVTQKMAIGGSVSCWNLMNWPVSIGLRSKQVNSFQRSFPRLSQGQRASTFRNRSMNYIIRVSILEVVLGIFLLTFESRMALEQIGYFISIGYRGSASGMMTGRYFCSAEVRNK